MSILDDIIAECERNGGKANFPKPPKNAKPKSKAKPVVSEPVLKVRKMK